MTLSIHHSNRIEILQARLAQKLVEQPPADPLAGEVVVVPTYALERWLRVQFARQQGIAANVHYPLATHWIWQSAARLCGEPGDDAFAAERLAWRIFALLPELVGEPAFAPLARYLQTDSDGVKRWQLAQGIGQVFERYQAYRRSLIEDWTAGDATHWQARLWRRLVEQNPQNHRVATLTRAIASLDDDACRARLPSRISLFALSSLPAMAIEFIHALAQRIDVDFYRHTPTDQYWADLVTERRLARQRLADPDRAHTLDTGNRLLSSWGRQGQAMQDLLIDLGEVTRVEVEAYRPPADGSLLERLQRRIFDLDDGPVDWPDDESLSVHICHSPARECQVLKDFLLDRLDRDSTLRAEEILVMVPQISRYAPYIEAAFDNTGDAGATALPWNLSDVSVGEQNPLVAAFLQLLRLPQSRFTRSEVLALVDCEATRLRFDLDANMVAQLRGLLDSAKVYWGIDATHRAELGLPDNAQNSWRQAWDRLFAGYALGDLPLWRDIAPIDAMDADAGIAVARFRQLFERLVYWRRELDRRATAPGWQHRLSRLVDDFFGASDSEDDITSPLRQAIAALDTALAEAPAATLEPAMIRYWLEQRLASTPRPGRLYSGGITICGMRPMRNIPFRVICLLGMQDSDFPRREQRPEFDLMVADWRPGDPVSADEDRYLMLETLLCARQTLYFSYCGRSLRDNAECQPSPLLRELLDTIDGAAEGEDGAAGFSERLVTQHPMQPFSPRNFTPGARGFDSYWHATANRVLAGREPTPTAWPNPALASAEGDRGSVELHRLARFVAHPIRFYFQDRLGIYLAEQDPTEDDEPFALQGLDKWRITQALAQGRLDGDPVTLQQLVASGDMPHGAAAGDAMRGIETGAERLFQGLEPYRDAQSLTASIDLALDDGSRLVGSIEQFYPGHGLLRFSASKSPRARHLMELWIHHLALCASGRLTADENSVLLSPLKKAEITFAALPANEAGILLTRMEGEFQRGLRAPLPLLPQTGLALACEALGLKFLEKPTEQWHGVAFDNAPPGENTDPYIRAALHGYHAEPLQDPLFRDTALLFFGDALGHLPGR